MTIKLWPHALFVNWYTVKISFRVLYPTHAPNAVGVWRKAWKKWLMPKWKTAIIWTDRWSQQCYVSHIWTQLECTYSVHANMHSVKIGNGCTENLVKKTVMERFWLPCWIVPCLKNHIPRGRHSLSTPIFLGGGNMISKTHYHTPTRQISFRSSLIYCTFFLLILNSIFTSQASPPNCFCSREATEKKKKSQLLQYLIVPF